MTPGQSSIYSSDALSCAAVCMLMVCVHIIVAYYGFEEGLTSEVVCDAGDVVIVRT